MVRSLVHAACCSVFCLLGLNNALAQEFSDLFAGRPLVTADSGKMVGDNASASLEPFEPRHGGRPGGHSMWVSWQASTSGIATFDTGGSSFDTLISVYTLDTNDPAKPPLERLKEVARADDLGASRTALVQFGAQAGKIYEIAVDGYAGASGDLRLNWDLLTSDRPLPVIVNLPPDRSLRVGDTLSLTVDYLASNDVKLHWLFNEDDVPGQETATLTIPNFQPENVGSYRLRLTSGGVRLVSAPVEIQINSEGEVKTLARDKLFASAESGLEGRDDRGGRVAGKRVALFAAPIGLTRGFDGVQIFNTIYAGRDPGEPVHCGVAGGASYWLSYLCPADGSLELDTAGSNFDTILAAYTYEPPLLGFESLSPVACDHGGGTNGLLSIVNFEVQKGRNYFIVVDGANGARGVAFLNYHLTPQGPLVPPSVTLSTNPVTLRLGEPLSLFAQASGSAPLTFQWQKDGIRLPDQTNTILRIPAAGALDAGFYTITVTNLAGQALSSSVSVSLVQAAQIQHLPGATSVRILMPAGTARAYQLEGSDTLTAGWSLLQSGATENGLVVVTQAVTGIPARFYRIRLE